MSTASTALVQIGNGTYLLRSTNYDGSNLIKFMLKAQAIHHCDLRIHSLGKPRISDTTIWHAGRPKSKLALRRSGDQGIASWDEGDALSQALMGALILIVKKPDDLLLRHTWYLFKLRDRIINYSFFQEKGLGLFNVPSDGNCFYHASCVWQGRYGKDGHLETRARTVDLTKALVKLFQEELQASTCSPALVRFMLESAFTEGSTVPMPLAEWYPVHLEQLGSWTNETALLLHSMLLGVPIYVLDRGTRQQRPWHRVSITTSNMEQLTAAQVARIRPPGYPVGQPGEAMYLVRCNDNHWLALGHADGSRLRDGEVDVLKLSEEVGLVVWKHTNTMGKAWHHGQSLAPC
ncbi:hypothetical protein QJQ45_008976 [Haematococcus lacustris]|nr:hypothetical protein QJQ45_008976 [Haematococcus lacustris]